MAQDKPKTTAAAASLPAAISRRCPNGVEHAIFKMRDNRLDNTAEVTVPAGQLFVLGDNRDNSADSRVSVRDGGVGLLPIDNLIGRADAVVGSWDMGVRSQPVWTWASGFRLARFFTVGALRVLMVRRGLSAPSRTMQAPTVAFYPSRRRARARSSG